MPRHFDKKSSIAATARKARARNIKLAKVFSCIIVVAAAFAGGFAVRGNVDLLDSLGLTQLTGSPDAKAKVSQQPTTYNSLSARVDEVEGIVNNDSLIRTTWTRPPRRCSMRSRCPRRTRTCAITTLAAARP